MPDRFFFYTFALDEKTEGRALLLDGAGEPVASCDLVEWGHRDHDLTGGWLANVHVREDARRQGYATALLRGVIAQARTDGKRTLSLCVKRGNDGARRCYERLGFVQTHDDAEHVWYYLNLSR